MSARGAGVGSFVSGLMEGANFAQNLQYGHKRKKALELALSQMDREEQAAQANVGDVTDEERAFYGDDTVEAHHPEFDGDPFLFRMFDWAKKRKGGKKRQAVSAPIDQGALQATQNDLSMSAPPAVEPPGVQDTGAATFALPDEPQAYADGGTVDEDSPEKIRERAAKSRARTPGKVEGATETVEGADRTTARRSALKDLGEKVPKKGAGFMRSTLAGGAAAAGIGGAVHGLQTPTEDYYTRLGLDPNDAGLSFWKDTGVRTAGVLSDVGATALGMLGIDQRSRFADQQPPQAAAPPPPRQALPTMGGAPSVAAVGRGDVVSTSPSPAPQPPQPGDPIDLSDIDVDSSELPNLNVADWKRVRAQALRTARLKGLPQGEALSAADQLVTGIQMRGFLGYASQAQALMQAGNNKGAVRALRAAYQYFPDGNDVKLGIHNNHIVGVGVDEKTGKMTDKPHVITPEFLAGAIQNFSNPQNFLNWTKDWRGEAFEHQKYNEVTKPLAEAQGQALTTGADARLAAAQAAQSRAGALGGLKQADMRGAQGIFSKRLELLGITDPQLADQLSSVMSQIKVANPQVPEAMIVDFVMKAKDRPDGMQFIQRALSGQ